MSVQDKDERAEFETHFHYQGEARNGDNYIAPEAQDRWIGWQASRRAAFDRAIELVAGMRDDVDTSTWRAAVNTIAQALTRERNG